MGAVAIALPYIQAAAPVLVPLTLDLVRRVEALFGAGTGPTKFDTVLKALLPVAEQLATAGKLPGIPDPAAVGGMIETVVHTLKAQGGLTPAQPATPNPTTKLAGTIQITATNAT